MSFCLPSYPGRIQAALYFPVGWGLGQDNCLLGQSDHESWSSYMERLACANVLFPVIIIIIILISGLRREQSLNVQREENV